MATSSRPLRSQKSQQRNSTNVEAPKRLAAFREPALGLLDPTFQRRKQRALRQAAATTAMRRLSPGDDRNRGRSVRRPDRGAGIAAAGAGRFSGGIRGPNENR